MIIGLVIGFILGGIAGIFIMGIFASNRIYEEQVKARLKELKYIDK